MEASSSPAPKARRPDYQRITGEVRDQIIKGTYAPGTRLPSTAELAVTWQSSVHTVHNALTALAKEGWIQRVHGTGTYVSEPGNRFTCAGIYHERDTGSSRITSFVRTLHDCLLEQLAATGKEAEIFVDSRSADKRQTLLPALDEAIRHRRIQCVIAPSANFHDSPALANFPLPIAFGANPVSPFRVDFNLNDFLRKSINSLTAQGCRSVGLITPFPDEKMSDDEESFNAAFLRVARQEGVETRHEWISHPPVHMGEMETHGYRAFHALWQLREKPDGLIVYPDMAVRGVIMAVLKFAIPNPASHLKFVFHRNAHAEMVCPFPVTWATAHEETLARQLIQMIETQLRGEKVKPTPWTCEFELDEASQWQ